MARPVACPKCSEELNVPDEFMGKQVRCAGCGHVFVAKIILEPPVTMKPVRDDFDDLPSRRAERSERGEQRSRTRRPMRSETKQGRSAGFWLFLIFGGMFGVCGLGCGGLFIFGLVMDNPTLKPYTAPDNSFKAGFPGPPITANMKDEKGRPKATFEHSRKLLQETFFIHQIDLKTKFTPEQAEDLLEDAVKDYLSRRPGSTEIDNSPTNIQGYPAVEVEIEHPDDTVTFMRVIVADKRLYFVGITGRGLVAESQRLSLFWDEFSITPESEAGTKKTTPAKDKADEDGKETKDKDKNKAKPKPKIEAPDEL